MVRVPAFNARLRPHHACDRLLETFMHNMLTQGRDIQIRKRSQRSLLVPLTFHIGFANFQNSNKNQWVGPVYSLGQLFGGLAAAFSLDHLGRKATITIGALCMELSTALLVWSPSFGVVVAARIIEGVSIGFLLLGYQVSYPIRNAWTGQLTSPRYMPWKSLPKRIAALSQASRS